MLAEPLREATGQSLGAVAEHVDRLKELAPWGWR
jgi:hypothetical protein